ncbi:MAG: M24 family metallopeptidase [Holosporales bacterium]|jgi:Xaa-Pro aminopeptidase|nr:M24 family metallopeptidase [Holosporales bacterium]
MQNDSLNNFGADALFVDVASSRLCDVSDFVCQVSGFTGSAGFLILRTGEQENQRPRGLILVDSRYTLQARAQCPHFDVVEVSSVKHRYLQIREWCFRNLRRDSVVAYANLSMENFARLKKIFPNFTFVAKSVEGTKTFYEIEAYDEKYCGENSLSKLAYVTEFVSNNGALLLSSPDSIAWLLNLRSKNVVDYSVAFPSLALIYPEGAYVFLPQNSFNVPQNSPNCVTYIQVPCCEFKNKLREVVQQLCLTTLLIDESQVPQDVYECLPNITIINNPDPILKRRCTKNKTELTHARRVHEFEGGAIIELLAWIDSCDFPFSELDVAEKLEEIRQKNGRFPAVAPPFEALCGRSGICAEGAPVYTGPSFRSIVASGANAAVVHHSPTSALCEGCVLIDVGGHYYGATTDMTRTIWIGKKRERCNCEGSLSDIANSNLASTQDRLVNQDPALTQADIADQGFAPSQAIVDAYTRVLRGHIALAIAIFPSGTTGGQLDALARQFLWAHKQDYGHGTGHGVGSYLEVHEGPCGISSGNMYPLMPGMILSNEPGFYKSGEFGVRLENLMQVCPCRDSCVGRNHEGAPGESTCNECGGASGKPREFLCFDTLTLVPFCACLTNFSELMTEEKVWLKCYHMRVLETASPHVSKPAQVWLDKACRAFMEIL